MRYLDTAFPILALWIRRVAGAYDDTLCNDGSYTSPESDLTYVPNAWNPDGKGFSCIAVRDSPPSFDSTWSWSSDPGSVHSYPHVKFQDTALPVPLSNISALTLSAQWAMGPGSTPRSVPSLDMLGLDSLDASANAAFDIFADRDPGNAGKETVAETEIMIWLGRIGHAQPLGYTESQPHQAKLSIGHVDFALYRGTNQRGTAVFTWAAQSDETSFAADVSPLLQHLWRNGLVSPGSYMGLIGFGTEGYHANGNVTFSAANYHANVLVAPAPTLAFPDGEDTTTPSPSGDSSSTARRLGAPWLAGLSISGMAGMAAVFGAV